MRESHAKVCRICGQVEAIGREMTIAIKNLAGGDDEYSCLPCHQRTLEQRFVERVEEDPEVLDRIARRIEELPEATNE